MNQELQLLPTGIQSFVTIRENNYLYVDKTKNIYDLLRQERFCFLSRPRRFGKSLLLSTLEQLFLGKKELFKGLWIDQSDYKWEKHPVIHLSLASIAHSTPEALYNGLAWELLSIAKLYGVDIKEAPSPQARFKLLITELAKLNSVVILVDEYDYPITNNMRNLELARACRDVLRSFFIVIKDLSAYVRFAFLTGVSKFSQTSLFSGLNNLTDLTLSSQAETLLGYTQEELLLYFEPYLREVAKKNKTTYEKTCDDTRCWYNGYQFSQDQQKKVYNPYSVLSFLKDGEFLNYWFRTGTPTFLLEVIKSKNFPIMSFDTISINRHDLDSVDIDNISLKALLFQTGYLTIKSYDFETKNYHLDFANHEVKLSFFSYLLTTISHVEMNVISDTIVHLVKALRSNNIDHFFQLLKVFFADIPSGIQIAGVEKYYQTIFFVLARVIGLSVQAEVMTNIGRIDLTLETNTHIYIIELKIDKSAVQALQQIEDKKYYQKYLLGNKTIVLIGASFDSKERNIGEWIVKQT